MNDWDTRKTSDNHNEWTVEGRGREQNGPIIELEYEYDSGSYSPCILKGYISLTRADLLEMLEALEPRIGEDGLPLDA